MPIFRYVGSPVLLAKALAAATHAVDDYADQFVEDAKADTPVLTGALAGGITSDGARASGSVITARVHTSGESNEYAGYVETGTSDTPAFRYLEGPATAAGPPLKAAATRAIKAAF